MDIGTWLTVAQKRLAVFAESPLQDAQVLLAHTLLKPRSWIAAHPEVSLTLATLTQLESSLIKLEKNVPLPYVLGEWEFYGRKFFVTPDVLIPRPETEHLIEAALAWLNETGRAQASVIDIGSGSGCIAVTLAAEMPGLNLIASDISLAALEVARNNAQRHQVNIEFVRADLLHFHCPPKDLIVSNPPYIPTKTLYGLDVYEREPTLALDGGPEGLDVIEKILIQTKEKLAPGGLCLMEIDSSQGQSAPRLARQYFPAARVECLPDLAGRARVLRIQT